MPTPKPKKTTKPAAGTPAKTLSKDDLRKQIKRLNRLARDTGRQVQAIADSRPNHKGRTPGRLFGGPHVTTGALGERPYSFVKAVAYYKGYIGPEQAKEEIQLAQKMAEVYESSGFTRSAGNESFLVPYATEHLPRHTTAAEKVADEVRQKMALDTRGLDPEEVRGLARKAGINLKTLGTLIDTSGGSFVAGPQFMELIDLQRNAEVFARAGASEIGLAPNGRMQWPKLTGGSTAYWAGEGADLTNKKSTPGTGDLLLEAKKLILLVVLNNELLRFTSLSAEAVVRTDMARQAALKVDQAMLEGTGGTQIRGLLQYPTQSSWTQGSDKVILYVPAGAGSDAITFQPEDFDRMAAKLPDEIEVGTWVMRKDMFGVQTSRRSDAVTAADAKGVFVVQRYVQDESGRRVDAINGSPVVKSSQVSKTRTRGSGTNLSYILGGFFPDWVIARMGVMELTPNAMADGAYLSDATYLRGIQHVDAGPRHAASFVLADGLSIA